MATTFIYALCEPGTRTVRYIGKAKTLQKRLKAHLQEANKGLALTYKNYWLRGLLSAGASPEMEIIDEVPEAKQNFFERAYIKVYREAGAKLTNLTDGGDGGYIAAAHTPEARAKRRASMKGKRPTEAVLAASQTPEAKAKRSAALKGRRPSDANLAATQTPEAKAKRRASKLGVPFTPEHCANISAGKKGKITEAMLAAIRDPEICAKKSAEMRGENNPFFGKKHTDEAKTKIRVKLQELLLSKGGCGKRSGATSAFNGVFWDSTRRKWKAGVTVLGRPIQFGRFDNEIDAARAYDAGVKKLRLARKLNFPSK